MLSASKKMRYWYPREDGRQKDAFNCTSCFKCHLCWPESECRHPCHIDPHGTDSYLEIVRAIYADIPIQKGKRLKLRPSDYDDQFRTKFAQRHPLLAKLSRTQSNVLRRHGYITDNAVAAATDEELFYQIRNLGRMGVALIREVIPHRAD